MNVTGAPTRSRHALPLLLTLLAPFRGMAGGLPAEAPAPSGLSRAMAHYERCEWEQAFDELVVLADAGNPVASRIALLMRTHGSRLFGHTFTVSTAQRQRWLDAVTAPDIADE